MAGRDRRGGGHGGGGGHDSAGGMRWLLTYADMITLLLALFIYLFSISTISSTKLMAFSTAFMELFGLGKTPIPSDKQTGSDGPLPIPGWSPESKPQPQENQLTTPPGEATTEQTLQTLKKQLEKDFPDWLQEGKLALVEQDEGLMLRLRDNALFDLGRADITGQAREVLAVLASRLREAAYPIRVEGHTDDLPVAKGGYFRSNWDLSGARAASVVENFIGQGIPADRLSLAGYAEYRPIAPNTHGQGNPLNRRVEIMILAPRHKPPPSPPGAGPPVPAAPDAAESRGGMQ